MRYYLKHIIIEHMKQNNVTFFLHSFILCVYVWVHMPHSICGIQRTTFRIQFPPFTMWIPGSELRLSVMVAKNPYPLRLRAILKHKSKQVLQVSFQWTVSAKPLFGARHKISEQTYKYQAHKELISWCTGGHILHCSPSAMDNHSNSYHEKVTGAVLQL